MGRTHLSDAQAIHLRRRPILGDGCDDDGVKDHGDRSDEAVLGVAAMAIATILATIVKIIATMGVLLQ